MTLTQRKKIVAKERKIINPENECRNCNAKLNRNSKHHFYCDECWKSFVITKINCKNCKYFDSSYFISRCCKFPPNNHGEFSYPKEHDWCGEFKRKGKRQ